MSKKVNFVVTAQKWDDNFEEVRTKLLCNRKYDFLNLV